MLRERYLKDIALNDLSRTLEIYVFQMSERCVFYMYKIYFFSVGYCEILKLLLIDCFVLLGQ